MMNPLSLIVPLGILLLAWLGATALDKQARRQSSVQGSYKGRQHAVPLIRDPEIRDERSSSARAGRIPMMSVGREIDVENKDVVCRACSWEGVGSELSTGLVRIENSRMFLFAYRCPACAGFELSRKGKLLAFCPQDPVKQQQAATAEERPEAGSGGSLSQWK